MKVCPRCYKELIEDKLICCISCMIELINIEAKEKEFDWRLVKVPGGIQKVRLD